MIKLDMKNCNMILTEKQKKYQHNPLEKFINMNILQVKKYYLLIKEEWKNKLRLLILLWQKLLKNKQKQLKTKVKSK